MVLNTSDDPIAYWNGAAGELWATEQEAIDRALEAFTGVLLDDAAIGRGSRVLDIGCGCGRTTLAAADAAGADGTVVGIDVSAPMLARARERAGARGNVRFVLGDAAEHAFDTTFDVALSRFGVMFFADPERAFAHILGVLRPGGALVFVCWRAVAENAWVTVPYGAAAPFLPPPPAANPEQPGPFAFADEARVRRILSRAGFVAVETKGFDADFVLSDTGVDDAVRFATTTGPTARALREAGEAASENVRAAIHARFQEFARGSRVALGGAVWRVQARRA
jgi:SAM-dependent methyltransferase